MVCVVGVIVMAHLWGMGLDSMLRRDVASSRPILIAEHEASLSTMCRTALLECWIVRHNGMTFLFLKCLRVKVAGGG